MSLERYAAAARSHCAEIADLLAGTGIEALRKLLLDLGRDAVLGLFREHRELMIEYLASPAAERRRREKRHRPEDLMVLRLGALWWGRRAVMLLDGIDRYRIEPGASYRMLTGEAARLMADLDCQIPIWPFEDEADPFEE